MKYFYLAAVFVLLLTHQPNAQEPVITPDTPASDATLDDWLHSKDPRLIAWAATLARQNHDTKIVAEMPELLGSWTAPPQMGNDYYEGPQIRAIEAVLDAIIQENVTLPASGIAKLGRAFPAQAAILISRLPLSESKGVLADWTFDEDGRMNFGALARIASMMLAKDAKGIQVLSVSDFGDISFAASVVAASENRLEITVRAKYKKIPRTENFTCGDGVGKPLDPGWPRVFIYGLDEDPSQEGLLIVQLGTDRITARRLQQNLGGGSCGSPKPGVEPLDAETRYRLIAYWLGASDAKMQWKPEERFTIVWVGKSAYEHRLGQIVESHREMLHDTVEQLRQLGFITPSEASTFTPKIVVTVDCDMKPCPLN